MQLRSLLLTVMCLCVFSSCKNEKEPEGYDAVSNTGTEVSPAESGVLNEDGPEIKMDTDSTRQETATKNASKSSLTNLTGSYIKNGEEGDNECSCYCLEVNLSLSTQLCLVPDEMYINARFERINGSTIDVYYDSPVTSNSRGSEIPWDKFDKNEPIARITPVADGEVQLDWLGFKINNDLAVDYAIYGKKSLEGTYKKK